MTPSEQKKAAKQFVERWQRAEGSEDREARSFVIELCQDVLGIANPTQRLDFERKVKGRKVDAFYEDMGILIEAKSRGVDLDEREQRGWIDKAKTVPRMVTPFEQAKWYADNITPRSIAPKWIVTCNFDELRIYDLDDEHAEEDFETIRLPELPDLLHRLSFFQAKENSRMERERQLSVAAGEVVGKLYDAFAAAYHDIDHDEREQRSLNVLITRIVFLLYAEDAGLLQERNAFYTYLKGFQVAHMRQALIDLFAALKTPDAQRDPYLGAELAAFPYVNGGLFAEDIVIPQFDENARFILLQQASAEFDWSHISPTIFGAVFESTLNPETRRSGGMHYTSVENIHKLTGPLFYDALKEELTAIEGLKTEKERQFKLNAFRKKIAGLRFLDPACGSGNFLTETYISLRKLENRVLEDLYGGQMVMGVFDPVQVTLDQFYGIEINDFAVEVAKTALWIAELQMLDQTREILSTWIDPLPLKTNDNIVCANALRMDWNDVLPAEKCNYVIGNPPFNGARTMSAQQKEELQAVAAGVRNNYDLDYVGGWYVKTADFMDENPNVRAALVSTNSICQGAQPGDLWAYLLGERNLEIIFAHRTFIWDSEATDKAHVHCVIVGFAKAGAFDGKRLLYDCDASLVAANINGYLLDAPNVYVQDRKKPLCDVPEMANGNQPRDGGNLLMKPDERASALAQEPDLERYIRPYVGADEFINNCPRYCIWLEGVDDATVNASAILRGRVQAVYDFRMASKAKTTNGYAKTPTLMAQRPQKQGVDFLLLPMTSGERRFYMPIGFMDKSVIANNNAFVVPDTTIYHFGILTSLTHNAWMRAVAGRLESRYRYSKEIVYNCFPWPDPTDEQHRVIERCAQAILDAREAHPGRSLAEMYDGISPMPENPSKSDQKKYAQPEYADLLAAHKALDAAVEAAYGVDFNGDEEKIVAHLFKLYAQMTEAK